MTEADPTTNDTIQNAEDCASTLLSGLENGDLSTGIYEGGFKTWECAIDLATYVLYEFSANQIYQQNLSIIELGAGSAVPSLALCTSFLEAQSRAPESQISFSGTGRLSLTLCDYNEEVLRLCTAPNLLLNHYFASSTTELAPEAEGDLDIEDLGGERFINQNVKALSTRNVYVDFISGSWGTDFVNLLTIPPPVTKDTTEPSNLLILASETIYSPGTLATFTSTLLSLLRAHNSTTTTNHQSSHSPPSARALIAAKKLYFGVGGGIDEFIREATSSGAKCEVVFESKDTGVGRVIVEVRLS
jgi:protein-histidine N-methyltransferase